VNNQIPGTFKSLGLGGVLGLPVSRAFTRGCCTLQLSLPVGASEGAMPAFNFCKRSQADSGQAPFCQEALQRDLSERLLLRALRFRAEC